MVRVLLTGGGTGGHVSPAVAVITRLRERSVAERWALELLFVGSEAGVERRAMAEMRVPYAPIRAGKLRRYFSLQTPVDLIVRVPAGFFQALAWVRRFRPDVIFSTGGYVCVPAMVAGRLLRVPSLTHEQTALVGLANRIAGRFATRVGVSFPQSARFFPPHKVILTGNPVRPSVLDGDAQRAASTLGFDPSTPTVYVTGGAQGSHAINMAVREALPRLLECCQVVHQCGQGPEGTGADLRALQEAREALPPAQQARYRVQAYVSDEIGDLYALSWLVVGRAGAGTVNELANLGKPSVLVPLPGAAGGEQEANARALEGAGGAVVLLEPPVQSPKSVGASRSVATTSPVQSQAPQEVVFTAESLTRTVCSLVSDRASLAAMSEGARKLANPGAADAIVDELLRLAGVLRE